MSGPPFDLRVLLFPMFFYTIGLGYYAQQSDFSLIFPLYAIFFATYFFILKNVEKQKTVTYYIFGGILLRCLLLTSFPGLSDDVYRFIWDGRLIVNGYNPFLHLPTYYVENNIAISGITPELFNELNSKEYFTIYPPVPQMIFAVAAWISPESWIGSIIVIRSFLIACEIGSIFFIKKLLEHFQLPAKNVLLYALNPLIIIELCGNLHLEATMIFFLLMGIYFLSKVPVEGLTFSQPLNNNRNLFLSAFAIALSIASKILPLMFLPFFIKRLGWKKSFQYFFMMGLILLLLFAPILSGVFFNNFGESLDLYFRKFEFNASIYYFLRWVGFQIVGYNLIQKMGPALGLIVMGGILAMAFFEKKFSWKNIFVKLLFSFSLYLVCATLVHPWYLSLAIVCSVFTKYRYSILWSALICLTYLNYSYVEYHENLWIVALEYLTVFGFFIWERKNKINPSTPPPAI